MNLAEKTAEERREHLRAFIKRRSLEPASWARAAQIAPSVLYNFLNGGSQSLSQRSLEKLADAAGAAIGDLIGAVPVREIETPGIKIIGLVQAGLWMPALDLESADLGHVEAPLARAFQGKAFGLKVNGTSMNLIYPEGTVIICIKLWDFEGDIEPGMRLVVYRKGAHDMVEATVKELRIDKRDGSKWLWPCSDDPAFQNPIPLPARDGGDDGEFGEEGEVVIHAVVISSTRPEPAFPLW
ncbi:MAG TPA: S24 family peptidase [Aliidongia sp.]|nr:S24 family peptidase [Aliidongia sp.]